MSCDRCAAYERQTGRVAYCCVECGELYDCVNPAARRRYHSPHPCSRFAPDPLLVAAGRAWHLSQPTPTLTEPSPGGSLPTDHPAGDQSAVAGRSEGSGQPIQGARAPLDDV